MNIAMILVTIDYGKILNCITRATIIGDIDLFERILLADADITLQDNKGLTALDYAHSVSHQRILSMLHFF